ncbi:unnamed protein product [Acanthoscelides obtectus]|uniref:Uncharacterized protein n=1 Tax=Acanthoscelides obtectus TaxID=200917 RepID=A0A9P0QAC0_ACAOB|nr:unnamed protein product [Acanthoscelides obtectus]CAK1680775.1 hypothetical protein AOBTE_LOCUS32872 [Acanthoscelides obtectus]
MDECKPKQHTAVPTTSLHGHDSSQLLTSFITSDQQTVAHNSTAIPVQLTTKEKMEKGKTPLKRSKKTNQPLQSTSIIIPQHLSKNSTSQLNDGVILNKTASTTTALPNNPIGIPGPTGLSNTRDCYPFIKYVAIQATGRRRKCLFANK